LKRSVIWFVIFVVIVGILSFATTYITMTSGTFGKNYQVLQQQIKIFEKENSDIKVNILSMPDIPLEMYSLYLRYLKLKAPKPDVLTFDATWVPALSSFLVDLRPYFENDIKGFFFTAVGADIWKGKLLAMPWFMDTGVLYYRQDLLKKYGFTPPKTWKDLIAQAEIISKKEKIFGFVWEGAEYGGLTDVFKEFIHSYGGRLLDYNGKVVTNTSMVRKGLQVMVNMIYKYKISPLSVTSYMEENARNTFQSGNAVFMRNRLYCWPLFSTEGSVVNGKVGIEMLPTGMGDSTAQHPSILSGMQLGINKYSKHIDAAVKLVKFLLSSRQETYRFSNSGQAPSTLYHYENPEFLRKNPILRSLKSAFINAQVRTKSPFYPAISQIVFVNVHNALTKRLTVEEAVRQMTNQLINLLGQK